jgi:cytochrome c biogenesis protein CcmG, thiol:disulfide interchange protein DsbE
MSMRIVPIILRLAWVFGLLLAGCGSASPQPPTVGQPAPDLLLPTLGGDDLRLADLRGSVVIVNFWATWCPPCVEETPRLVGWSQQYADQGLRIVGVDTLFQDSRAKVEQFVADKGVGYPILVDETGDITRQWQARQLPRSFVIDRDGVVRFVKLGEITEEDFVAEIAPLLGEG